MIEGSFTIDEACIWRCEQMRKEDEIRRQKFVGAVQRLDVDSKHGKRESNEDVLRDVEAEVGALSDARMSRLVDVQSSSGIGATAEVGNVTLPKRA